MARVRWCVHASVMTDEKKPDATQPTPPDRPASDAPPPTEELRKAFDHLGKAALSFKERYLSDERIQEVTEKARVNAEQIAGETEKALRKAGGSLDTLAVDAEKSVEKVAVDVEKALREAQKAAAPALRAGLAKLSSLLEGRPEPLPEDPENARNSGDSKEEAPTG